MDRTSPKNQVATIGTVHTSDIGREDITFRFKPHVAEYICPGTPNKEKLGNASVFAGGGITNCPDWQEELVGLVDQHISQLSNPHEVSDPHEADLHEARATIINPRRTHFPIHDPTASLFQINWEASYLAMCKATSFWFPSNTEGPITLFETGKWMMRSKPFFVGIEPGYPRARELLAHIKAVRPDLEPACSLSDHARNIALWALGQGRVSLPERQNVSVPHTLYLSGGIVNCPDWQGELVELLNGVNCIPINPRVKDFQQGTDESYFGKVRLNRKMLDSSEAAVVWFPKEQLTPVALLELGSVLACDRPLFIGIENGYRRQVDVEIQTQLERPELDIVYSLRDLAEQVKAYYSMRSISSLAS